MLNYRVSTLVLFHQYQTVSLNTLGSFPVAWSDSCIEGYGIASRTPPPPPPGKMTPKSPSREGKRKNREGVCFFCLSHNLYLVRFYYLWLSNTSCIFFFFFFGGGGILRGYNMALKRLPILSFFLLEKIPTSLKTCRV